MKAIKYFIINNYKKNGLTQVFNLEPHIGV